LEQHGPRAQVQYHPVSPRILKRTLEIAERLISQAATAVSKLTVFETD
jgi:hypothetical protein